MDASSTETKWITFGKPRDFVFLGRDTIATASGIYVSFFELKTRRRRIERFDGEERGDGASCLAGHPTVPMFSVAESRINPDISVFVYPSMKKISCCPSIEETNGYLSCAFVGTEFLLGQTTFPDFRMIVWFWKTGEKATIMNTTIKAIDRQITACSPNSPHLIAQFAPSSGSLSVYRLLVCSKIVNLMPVEFAVDTKGSSVSWTQDGNLLLCDEHCNVFFIAFDGRSTRRVVQGDETKSFIRANRMPLIAAYENGALLAVPETNIRSKITFYRSWSESCNEWPALWSIPLRSHPVYAKPHPRREGILVRLETGETCEIVICPRDSAPRLEVLLLDGIGHATISPQPLHDDYLAVLDQFHGLRVLDPTNGEDAVPRLNLEHHGEVLCMQQHPHLPIIATCSATGNCLLVLVLRSPLSSKILNCFHLHRECLDRIRFSVEGGILAVGCSQAARIFIISRSLRGNYARVAGVLSVEEKRIIDFLVYEESSTILKILVLVGEASGIKSGRKILIYSCEIIDDLRTNLLTTIELPKSFQRLHQAGLRAFVGSPYLSKQLHRMEIQEGFRGLVLTDVLPSMHQSRNAEVNVSGGRVVTCGYDGLIVVRDGQEVRRVLGLFVAHHRGEAGARNAAIVGETIVTLGRNGDLVATKLRIFSRRGSAIRHPESRCVRGNFFCESCIEFYEDEEETWLENVLQIELKAQRMRAEPLRMAISRDLENIRIQITALLDANEAETPEARLPISCFDLDVEGRKRRIELAAQEREEARRNLENECARYERVTLYLQKKFWQPLVVPPCAVASIVGETMVKNYPLKDNEAETKEDRARAQFFSGIRDIVSGISNGSGCNEKTEEIQKNLEMSTDIMPVIRPSNLRCGYVEALENNILAQERERSWKIHFNRLFEAALLSKKEEMEETVRRIERWKYCADEYQKTFRIDRHAEILEIPKWRTDESPEHIVTVRDEELTVKPYQSPREEAQPFDALNSKESSIKLTFATKQDHRVFQEQALEKMMDGTLEIRWEDDLKKDIPMPECMRTKDPSKFSEEDLEVVKSYTAKVKALEAQREKYKSILEEEITRTKDALQSSIGAFDDRLKELSGEKIKAESAILREKLMRYRTMSRHRSILKKQREISKFVEDELLPTTRESRRLVEICGNLEVALSELRNRYEAFCKRDKLLEGKFRSEFEDLKRPMVDHLFRHYGRRPRIGRVVSTSVTYLTELGRCILENESSDILPRDCLDFLRGMYALDAMPNSLPSKIDDEHWRSMCKLRRIKIENEIKVKSCAIEIAEAEETISIYQKAGLAWRDKAVRCRERVEALDESLAGLRAEDEVALVLKTGQVKIKIGQNPADFSNAVLMRREEFLGVNEAIFEGARKKLSVLRARARLRRSIALEEWLHECTRTTMEQLREDLEHLRAVKVTREMRESLEVGQKVSEAEEEQRILSSGEVAGFRRVRRSTSELRKITEESRVWRERNECLAREIERRSAESERCGRKVVDSVRSRAAEFEKRKLGAVAKRLKRNKQIRENYEDLLSLHARLEVLKLRTYPTLN